MNELPIFQLREVCKYYGDTLAVNIEHLDVQENSVLCLLGPTGAGKSTLLRLLAAVENTTGGTIGFGDDDVQDGAFPLTTRRSITMVFQRPLLLSGTVRWNVEYGLRLRGEGDFSRVDRMLQRLGLTDLSEQSAHTLSGGQTQLVALARALVIQPRVLLLDEPTANLDPAHVALVEHVIGEATNSPTSIIWATHNLFQARRIAQQVALMLNGQVIEVAPNDKFFDAPSDPRTRDFVDGKMVY